MAWTIDANGDDVYVDDSTYDPNVNLGDLLDQQGVTPTYNEDSSWVDSPEFADYLKGLVDSQDIYTSDPSTSSSGNLSGLSNVLKSFMGSDTGKALLSGLGLAGTLAPIMSNKGNQPTKTYYDISKFAPGGEYKPVDLGYERAYQPTNWSANELDLGKHFFGASPNADQIYNKASQVGLNENQLADLYSRSTGNNFGGALNAVRQYVSQTGGNLGGGYVPQQDAQSVQRQVSSTSSPLLRTKYAQGGR